MLILKSWLSKRDIVPDKLIKGLGLKKMATPDFDEDSASIAANSLYRLIVDNNIDPRKVGRVYLGTESGVDASKPTSSYVVEILKVYLKINMVKDALKIVI